ncbi:MAG: ABC transporter ATP-binding protein [Actinomycetota bacterium]|nr:ABC transporter ATP-binding protein [Actinomycetota bacterium]
MSRPPAIVVEGVTKAFTLPRERRHTLKERVLRPGRTAGERFQALRDVSLRVDQGEFFGIVGRNGSGKSTLLKCLAGIYRVDGGRIAVAGRLSPFIELGVGFNPDLAARDNVLLNGLMLGLTPREALRRFDEIVAFAELEDFVDLKLKNYSSGMQVRLAFSVMAQVDADVYLIDEVLAVGDAAFQQKCFDVFARLRDRGRTIVLVTHDMAAVRAHCDRATLLEGGAVRLVGDPERVGTHYLELNFGRDHAAQGPGDPATERFGDAAAEVLEAWFEDEDGQRTDHLPHGAPLTFRMQVRFRERMEDAILAFALEDDHHTVLFASGSAHQGLPSGVQEAGEELVYGVRLRNVFARGRLHATPWVLHGDGVRIADRRPRLTSLVVTALQETGAVVDLPHDAVLERAGERV